LVRHGLIEVRPRRKRRADYKRWERSRAMELWQMDVVGGVRLADGWKASVVTGIDDHSRFCVSALVVRRPTARPVCDALARAMRTHGVPAQILTDNGKVFTGRFGPGTGEVLFDRICRENGIKHLLTAPGAPTTTGKVERFHKTLRREFLDGQVFADLDEAQAAIGAWVTHYNHDRPHQAIGMVAPWERFRLADPDTFDEPEAERIGPVTTRVVGRNGKISFAGCAYRIGAWLASETVEVTVDAGVVSVHHRDVLVAAHAQRHRPDKQAAALQRAPRRRSRPSPSHHRSARDPQSRLQRLDQLRRRVLPSRQSPSTPPSPTRDRRRRRRDLLRRRAAQDPPHPPRPLPRARRVRQPRRQATPHQRRLNPGRV
jgi:hypothetical protein